MKRILILLLIVFSVAISIAAEADLTADEAQALENFVKSNMTKEYEEIKAGAISELFNARFFTVNVMHNYTDYNHNDEIVVVEFNGEFSELKSINDLIKYLDPSYKITSLEDTESFALAVLKIFPSRYDSFRDGIYQVENEWFFIYSKFFDDKDGIVVTVDDEGKISAIETRGGIQ